MLHIYRIYPRVRIPGDLTAQDVLQCCRLLVDAGDKGLMEGRRRSHDYRSVTSAASLLPLLALASADADSECAFEEERGKYGRRFEVARRSLQN